RGEEGAAAAGEGSGRGQVLPRRAGREGARVAHPHGGVEERAVHQDGQEAPGGRWRVAERGGSCRGS
ncbi:unnamed protein product, partial [Prorocentrum cordatum]